MGDGLRIGRVAGVPVLVRPSWLAFAALTVLTYGPVLGSGQRSGYLVAAAFSLLLLASVLLHELGHCLTARALGLPVRRVTVSFLAGLTEITQPPQTPARELAVAVAGPLVSVGLAAGALAGTLVLPAGTVRLVCGLLAVTNGLVAGLNLLPGLPLDGGRVLRACVWRLTGDPYRASVVAAWSGRVLGVAVLPAALAALALTGREPTLVAAVLAGLLGAFVYAGATASLRAARVARGLPALTVQALARPALSVRGDVPLAEALRRAHEAQLHAVVVVDADGRPYGVVSEAAVAAVPEQRRPWVSTDSVARTLTGGLLLDPGLAGEPLLAAMRAYPATEYVAADPVRGPVRVLSAADVGTAIS